MVRMNGARPAQDRRKTGARSFNRVSLKARRLLMGASTIFLLLIAVVALVACWLAVRRATQALELTHTSAPPETHSRVPAGGHVLPLPSIRSDRKTRNTRNTRNNRKHRKPRKPHRASQTRCNDHVESAPPEHDTPHALHSLSLEEMALVCGVTSGATSASSAESLPSASSALDGAAGLVPPPPSYSAEPAEPAGPDVRAIAHIPHLLAVPGVRPIGWGGHWMGDAHDGGNIIAALFHDGEAGVDFARELEAIFGAVGHDEGFEVFFDDLQLQEDDDEHGRQNVHDHSVASTMRENLRRLRDRQASASANKPPPDLEIVRECVRDHLLESTSIGDAVKQDALDVVDSLSDAEAVSAGTSQLGALSTVWTAIDDIQDPVLRNNVRTTLVEQLAGSKERGKVVCSTGVIARIASVLDGVDDPSLSDRQRPRPMWVLRQELASLASKCRDQNADDPDRARTEFENRVETEYVRELGLSRLVVAPILAEFMDHF